MNLAALLAVGLGAALGQVQQAPARFPEGVSLDFRQADAAHGLKLIGGPNKIADVGGVRCVQTDPNAGLYITFEAPREMILPGRETLTFQVTYLDSGSFPVILMVESALPAAAIGDSHWRSVINRRRTGTDTWTQARWQVTDDAFCDPARDAIRFRLYDEGWDGDGRILSIASVKVTHEAVRFRPQQDAVLCGKSLPVVVEAYNAAGDPLPDGTEVKLSCQQSLVGLPWVMPQVADTGPIVGTDRQHLAGLPKSVTLTGGKAAFDLKAGGPQPGTARLFGLPARAPVLTGTVPTLALPAGAPVWMGGWPVYVLAGEGEIAERTDAVEPANLKEMVHVNPDSVADSTLEMLKDKEGQDVLRVRFTRKKDHRDGYEPELNLNIPIAGVPKRLCVYLGCPDKSLDSIIARVADKDGEVFAYELGQWGAGPLPPYAECRLDIRAVLLYWGRGGAISNGVLDPPCLLQSLCPRLMPGLNLGTLDIWAVETDVLAPGKGTKP